jgi:cell wall assembly regulator SMI1
VDNPVAFLHCAILVAGALAVQKFTRPLTREVELGGARLALTFSDQGISVRPVGSRKTPWELSWNTVICHVTGRAPKSGNEATPDEAAAAVELLRQGAPSKSSAPTATPAESATRTSRPSSTEVDGPAAGVSNDVGSLLSRLDEWFTKHRSRYHEGLLPGASSADLDALHNSLCVSLPAEARALLRWHNGQSGDFVGHFENNWDLMNTSQILAAKQELDEGDPAQTGWQKAWVPFLDDNAGDYVCVDTSQPGGAVREYWQGKTQHPVVAPSLTAWLEQYVKAVEQGGYHEDPERGTFVRSHV